MKCIDQELTVMPSGHKVKLYLSAINLYSIQQQLFLYRCAGISFKLTKRDMVIKCQKPSCVSVA